MFRRTLTFLVVAILAGAFGAGEGTSVMIDTSRVLCLVFAGLFLVSSIRHLSRGLSMPTP